MTAQEIRKKANREAMFDLAETLSNLASKLESTAGEENESEVWAEACALVPTLAEEAYQNAHTRVSTDEEIRSRGGER